MCLMLYHIIGKSINMFHDLVQNIVCLLVFAFRDAFMIESNQEFEIEPLVPSRKDLRFS